MSNLTVAIQFRNRAELLRTIADETVYDEHRRSLRRVAQYYEAMAGSLERGQTLEPKPTKKEELPLLPVRDAVSDAALLSHRTETQKAHCWAAQDKTR
jgi:hypothetical protein